MALSDSNIDTINALLRNGDVLEYDEQERWLVVTQFTGASAIVARDVDPWLGRWAVDRATAEVPSDTPLGLEDDVAGEGVAS